MPIAIVKITPVAGSPEYGPDNAIGVNHVRYASYRKVDGPVPLIGPRYQPATTSILLLYPDLSIQQYLEQIKLSFNTRRNVGARRHGYTATGAEDTLILSASVSGMDRIVAKVLGKRMGFDCYVVYSEASMQGRNELHYFSIDRVPRYGTANTVVMEEHTADCFNPNRVYTDVLSAEEQGELFAWMHEQIKPIAAQMIANMKPVEYSA